MLVGLGSVPVLSRRTPGLKLRQKESGDVAETSEQEREFQSLKTDVERAKRHQTKLILMDRSGGNVPALPSEFSPDSGAPVMKAGFGVTGLSGLPMPLVLGGLGVIALLAHSMLKKR